MSELEKNQNEIKIEEIDNKIIEFRNKLKATKEDSIEIRERKASSGATIDGLNRRRNDLLERIMTELNLKEDGLYDLVWQAGAILLPVRSVGVMGDERTYENTVSLRAVQSTDGMTADWVHLPYDFLSKVSNKIINKVKGINRVVYDISSKPPATIEWE